MSLPADVSTDNANATTQPTPQPTSQLTPQLTPPATPLPTPLPAVFRDGDRITLPSSRDPHPGVRTYTRRWGRWHESLDRKGARPLSDAELRDRADTEGGAIGYDPRPRAEARTRDRSGAGRKVVVTGLGAITPLGLGAHGLWHGLLDGRCGVRSLDDQPDFADQPVRIAGTVPVDPADLLPPARARRMNRAAQFALIAAREAWQDAGFEAAGTAESGLDPDRVGVSMGTIIGGAPVLVEGDRRLRDRGVRAVSPLTAPMTVPSQAASQISLDLTITGEARTVVSACASGTEAIGQAVDRIRYGKVDVMLAGGTEAVITPAVMASFSAMRAMSTRNNAPTAASRPFDRDRDGFVHGEGAGLLVLEAEEHALARGARIYCEAAGWGLSADAHHMAAPDPSGRGVALAIRRALADADAHAVDVLHVNAHATATVEGDLAESTALREVLGESGRYPAVPVTAIKGNIGHLQGAAGGVEAVVTALTLHHGLIPPTIGCDEQDDEIPLDVVRHPRALPATGDLALSNSFGFGGHNAVLALRRRGHTAA